MILDSVSWHPHCVLEIEEQKLNRVSTHVGVNEKTDQGQVTIYKKYQRIDIFLLIQKKGEEILRQT